MTTEQALQKAEAQLRPIIEQYDSLRFPKQNDWWDVWTDFIYWSSIKTFDTLIETIDKRLKGHQWFQQLKDYAIARWFNFRTSKAAEWLFCKHPGVVAEENTKHPHIDFYIDGTEFDLKVTTLPKGWSLAHAQAMSRREILNWYFTNQSQGRRYGYNNRIILIVHDSIRPEHSWKLKGNLELMSSSISQYMLEYKAANLIASSKSQYAGLVSDVILAVK